MGNELEAKLKELDELQHTLTREEFIAKVETELKPLWEKELLSHGCHEPDWAPLEKALPYKWCGGFMFMGYEGEIRVYKQGFTRACLYLDPAGNAYAKDQISFRRIPVDDAIEAVFKGIEDLGFTRSTKYDERNAEKRRKMVEKETGYKIITFGR